MTNRRITTNKHNLARSVIDQPCDISETFKLLKRIYKEYIVEDVPNKLHPTKKAVRDLFISLAETIKYL